MPCRSYNGGTLHVCGPAKSDIRPLHRRLLKFCFECRRRVDHDLMLIDQAWYDLETFWQCCRCKLSATTFPGCG